MKATFLSGFFYACHAFNMATLPSVSAPSIIKK